MTNIDLFTLFRQIQLSSIIPNDIIFEIGKTIFGIYKVPKNMNIKTLNKIGPYIYMIFRYHQMKI